MAKLYEVEPREQIGARTGSLYEYQYHQAAAGSLSLIEKTDTAVCLYCEWHDDYVLEAEADGRYAFFQVKTNSGAKWTVGEFFGLGKLNKKTGLRSLPKRKADAAAPPKKSSIFSNLWDHTQKFGDLCKRFVFLSDAELDSELQALVDDSKGCIAPDTLSEESKTLFQSLVASLKPKYSTVTDATFFAFLQRLYWQPGVGTPKNLEDVKILIINKIVNASEVDIKWSEGQKMGTDLVNIVRTRSHLVLSILPANIAELREKKGLVVRDVIKLLSLSEEGFRALKEGAGDAVKTLSRLQRFCRRREIPDDLIPQFCELKTSWSAWWLKHADLIDKLDYMTFKSDCLELLKAHSSGTFDIGVLAKHAKDLATKYNSIFNPLEVLRSEAVMGFIISLAVDAET
jgi:hypothetical protein